MAELSSVLHSCFLQCCISSRKAGLVHRRKLFLIGSTYIYAVYAGYLPIAFKNNSLHIRVKITHVKRWKLINLLVKKNLKVVQYDHIFSSSLCTVIVRQFRLPVHPCCVCGACVCWLSCSFYLNSNVTKTCCLTHTTTHCWMLTG